MGENVLPTAAMVVYLWLQPNGTNEIYLECGTKW